MLVAPAIFIGHIAAGEVEGSPIIYEAEEVEVIENYGSYSNRKTTEQEIVDRLGESHPLVDVARCESSYRQLNDDGSLLRGSINPQDVGVLQINERYHLDNSRKLGYDIHTLEGNLDYGEYLYETQGLTPWSWSEHCWGK